MRMKIVLGFVIALFLGLLLATYLVSRQADPIMLDEHGHPVNGPAAVRHPHG